MTEKIKPSKRKLLLFKLLSVLLPFVLLFLLELVLRFFNYGHNTDLFVKDPDNDRFMMMNYYASDKFFSDTVNATKGNHELFEINKSPNTFRIFVLGESTTIGYPYFHNGSFHRWLQYRLMNEYPDINFEIINLSLTAVNSYTVLDFGRQLKQYQPDAVLIYTGHNEYYGALGVGSTNYVGSNHFLVETLIKLRELKVVQLLNNSIKKVAGVFSSSHIDSRTNLMQRMAARQHIDLNSSDYKTGIQQYNTNMTELCQLLNNDKIPTFLSTVVSNEKDLPPFISNGKGPGSAIYYYMAGKQAMSRSDFVTAKIEFDKAKELDALRFRAPDAINTLIRKMATDYSSVHLVDTKAAFEQNSPDGIVGHETILEHVHPNLFGYAIMSDAFYKAITAQHILPGEPMKTMSFAELQKQMPITRFDSLAGEYQIMALKTGWPFNQPISKDFKLSANIADTLAGRAIMNSLTWKDAMAALYANAQTVKDTAQQVKIMESLYLEEPQNEQYCTDAANLNAAANNYDAAAFYYVKLHQLTQNDRIPITVMSLYLRADEPRLAIKYAKYLPQERQTRIQNIIQEIINGEEQLKKNPENTAIKDSLKINFKKLGITYNQSKYEGK